jgi:methionyl aminopeptidase
MIILKTSEDINAIRKSCKIVSKILSILESEAKEGLTTRYLDKLSIMICKDMGAIPGFVTYKNFGRSICTSINNEVVHGRPSNRVLKDGDILSIDCGVIYGGWWGDSAVTIPIGNVNDGAKELIYATKSCLDKGIIAAKAFNRIGDISHAIETESAKFNYTVVKEFTGHGVGKDLHEYPPIPNFGNSGEGEMLKPGMVIAIEPIISSGNGNVITLNDKWTVVTIDNSLSAHFEHTVAITTNGVEILTDRN